MVDGQVQQQQQQRVSLAELLEVRNGGLTAAEVLTVLVASCDNLVRLSNRRGLFTTEQIFLTRDGRIEIQLIPIADTPKQSIPPELLDQPQPFGQSASDAHLVWCLGRCCAQASASDHSDVALHSLLNLMTVSHVQSRPALPKVKQMVRNRMDVVEAERQPQVISALFREVMGDLDELAADPFGDDIRFSSSRSSQLSIVPGPGAPEHQREKRDQELEAYQQELASEVADRLRRDFSLSRKHSQKGGGEEDGQMVLNIPDQLQPQKRQKPVPSPRRGLSPETGRKAAEDEDEELTPRGPSPVKERREGGTNPFDESDEEKADFVPINVLKTEPPREEKELDRNNPFFGASDDEHQHQQVEAVQAEKAQTSGVLLRPNAEAIQVEVHSPSPSHDHHDESSSPSTHPKSARLYAKATQANKATGRAAVVKKMQEIEILPVSEHPETSQFKAYNEDEQDAADIAIASAIPTPNGMRRKPTPPKVSQRFEEERQPQSQQQQQQFSRQNSLQPGRCSRRASSGGRAAGPAAAKSHSSSRLPAVPEFLANSNSGGQPSIRLRAQSMKKKKMVVTLHRSEPAVVIVRLLDGHSVEVNCKTDQLVGAVFHTVAEHLNITEHLFFGLVLQQQPSAGGECIFLEEEHRLEKWAPSGWKSGAALRRSFGAGGTLSRSPASPAAAGDQFMLHLRFRYYPKKREFVKTPTTAHQLYLQLRQDMLSGALRFQPREKAVEMAALALCVECGPPPSAPGDYFKLENYLPTKYYDIESGEILQVHRDIMEGHARLAEQMGRLEAEERFIALCQAEPYYGSHFYRVHKMKPKRGQYISSDHRLVAIMPSGIGTCREERGGIRRLFTSMHEWHQIRTLQFDRKRFLLGTVENGLAVDHVFYTDHHSKAAYLVRFAASQHRFMLKMRQWQGTLNRMRAMQRHRDVGIEIGEQQPEHANDQQTLPAQNRRNGTAQPQMGISAVGGQPRPDSAIAAIVGTERRQSRLLAETDKEYIQYCYGPDAQRVEVVLEKHPELGLGLTLVDGAVNGVKGVYVKSLSAEGDGRRKGLQIGDCLLSINGVSLFNQSRHDAVELVRDCGHEVRLEILRFPSISEVLAQEPIQTVLSAINGKVSDSPSNTMQKRSISSEEPPPLQAVSARRRSSLLTTEEAMNNNTKSQMAMGSDETKRKESTMTTQSRTSTGADSASTGSAGQQHRRQRAVSDFGSALPAFRTDDILAAGITPKGRPRDEQRHQRYKRHKTSAGFPESRTSEDSAEEESTDSESEQSTNRGGRKGEYLPSRQPQPLSLPPVSAMYGTLGEDEDDDSEEHDGNSPNGNGQQPPIKFNQYNNNNGTGGNQKGSASPYMSNNKNTSIEHSPFAAAIQRYAIGTPNGNSGGTGWNNHNGSGQQQQARTNLDWTNDLSDLATDSTNTPSPHQQQQKQAIGEDEQILTVTLDKAGGNIGLSLAKRMGHEGVYVRNIAAGSLAAQEGTLSVGDRIWRIQGTTLAPDESPANVVKKLKEANGPLHVEVKRKHT